MCSWSGAEIVSGSPSKQQQVGWSGLPGNSWAAKRFECGDGGYQSKGCPTAPLNDRQNFVRYGEISDWCLLATADCTMIYSLIADTLGARVSKRACSSCLLFVLEEASNFTG